MQNLQKENSAYISALTEAGFIIPAKVYDYTPDDFEDNNEEYLIHNKLGIYIGDLLELKGWSKETRVKSKRSWVVFTHPQKMIEISHRYLSEFKTKVFTAKSLSIS